MGKPFERLNNLHDRFVAMKLSENLVNEEFTVWLQKEEDVDICGELVDILQDSDDRLKLISICIDRVNDLRRKGETWKKTGRRRK